MAVIYPSSARDGQRDLARILLALADHPRDVETVTDNGFAFVVPEYLHDKYLRYLEPEDTTPAMVEQAARRPGRPRKTEKKED